MLRLCIGVAVLAFSGCSGKGGPSTAHLQLAEKIHDLYHHWDAAVYRSLLPLGPAAPEMQARWAWYREQLGDCERPRTLANHGRRVSFTFQCKRGVWEAAIEIGADGSPAAVSLLTGGRGLEPPPRVRYQANQALALFHDWNDALMEQTFGAPFNRAEFRTFFETTHRTWGGCLLSGVDLGGPTGALLELDCEAGPRLMVMDLGSDSRIERFFLRERRSLPRTHP